MWGRKERERERETVNSTLLSVPVTHNSPTMTFQSDSWNKAIVLILQIHVWIIQTSDSGSSKRQTQIKRFPSISLDLEVSTVSIIVRELRNQQNYLKATLGLGYDIDNIEILLFCFRYTIFLCWYVVSEDIGITIFIFNNHYYVLYFWV